MQLAIPVLHNPQIHGEVGKPYINHYLNYGSISREEFFGDIDSVNELLNQIKLNMARYTKHDHLIRNYWKISLNPKIELVEVKTLDSGEEICLIKTHLIKMIQRRWRANRIN
jgi:hypothetical protein